MMKLKKISILKKIKSHLELISQTHDSGLPRIKKKHKAQFLFKKILRGKIANCFIKDLKHKKTAIKKTKTKINNKKKRIARLYLVVVF